ncbi:MAG: SDR family oxidoreductase [Candidatus Binatia bacterium]
MSSTVEFSLPVERREQAETSFPSAPFAGKLAVVTGASSGIGKAIAGELSARGAAVCLLGRRLETLQTVARTMQENARTLAYQIDLTAPEQIESFADSFSRDCGQVDMLVHSAGVIAFGSLETASVRDLDRQFNVNVRAPYLLTRALLPMLKSRQGQIVFINSSAGLSPVANSGQYSATKHALKAVADTLREEINSHGVRVLNVFAGRTATPMQATVHAYEDRPYRPEKLMKPEDVASMVAHALSFPTNVEVTAIHMRSSARAG